MNARLMKKLKNFSEKSLDEIAKDRYEDRKKESERRAAKKTKKEKNIKEEIDVKKAKDVKIEPSYSAGKTFKAKGGKEYHEKSGE